MEKVLVLANNDVGLYKFRKELVQELIKQGKQVFISLPNGELVQSLIDMGCIFIDTHVDRRGMNPITDFKLLLHYFKILKNVKPDIVITYTVKPNIYGGIISRVRKVPYAINVTGLGSSFQNEGIFKKVIVFLYKIACKEAKVIFFENEENQQIFINNKIVNREKACKLNGAGVNLEEYKFCEYPKDNGEIRFLFIGRVMKEKGVDELFEAAKRIKSEYDNVVFDVVGPFEEHYEIIVQELEANGIIKFHGFQSDVKQFIEKTNCFVLASYHEGMANTLLESSAMGRPVITTNIHGCKEAYNKKNGYVCNPKDIDDLYDKISRFIELPYLQKQSMGRESRNHMEKFFDKSNIVKSTIKRLR